MKRVLVIDAVGQGPFSLSVVDGALTIGESPENAEVALRDLHILRVHCEIEVAEDEVVVSAPAAAMHVGAGEAPERYELHSGEEIHIGHAHLRLDPAEEEVDAGPAMDETLPDRLDRTPAPAPLSGVRLAAALTASRKQLLVIDEHDLDHHCALAASRTVTETTQPPESMGPARSVPPWRLARSRMPSTPCPPGPVRSPV